MILLSVISSSNFIIDSFIKPESVIQLLTPETTLVCIMAVNNETGIIQPINKIADTINQYYEGKRKPKLHIDCVQAAGKIPLDLSYNGIDSAAFVKTFMKSEIAKALDSTYNRMQWAGEEYLLEEVISSAGNLLAEKGEIYSADVLYWMGYIYRYWHYYSGEDSAKIYKQAPVETMKRNYMIFHTMDPVLAIEDLKEIHNQ